MIRAAFLDRDGTIIVDEGYLDDPDRVVLLPRVIDALKELQTAGYELVIVTNQSGVGRGYYGVEAVDAVNGRLRAMLAEHGVTLLDVYICPHRPDEGCTCRKPAPGMLLQAAEEHGINLTESVMVGDKVSDAEAGQAAGCQTNIVLGQQPHTNGYPTAQDLYDATQQILNP